MLFKSSFSLLLTISSIDFCSVLVESSTIKFAHVLFRHGDRSPTKTFPSDPYNETVWLNGYGQLTKTGMEQAYTLGQFLADRYKSTVYPGFLSQEYTRKEIFTVSTDTDRTLNTAQCMLAGLFPPGPSRVWGNDDIGQVWQPIPIRSLEYGVDPLLSADIACKRYDEMHDALLTSSPEADALYKANQLISFDVPCNKYDDHLHKALDSDEAKSLYEENQDHIEYVCRKAGWNESSFQNTWDTYDPLFCMKIHDLALPAWADQETYEWLAEFEMYEFDFWFHNDEMIKLRAGTYVKELLSNFSDIVENKNPDGRKINFYSTHDTLIAAVLYALGVWNRILPPYTCTLMIELHEPQPDEYTVQVYYRNHTGENPNGPYQLQIQGCAEDCPWPEFKKLLSRFSLDDFNEACGQTDDLNRADSITSGGVAALVLFGVTLVICLSMTALWCYRKRSPKFHYSPPGTDVSANH